jgi:hypothetical protein
MKDGEGATFGWTCSGAYSLSSTFAWAAAGAAAKTDMAAIAINRRERMSIILLGCGRAQRLNAVADESLGSSR